MTDAVQERINGLDRLLVAEIRSVNETFARFEQNVGRRFEQVNEFRGALDDLGKQMATRRELETAAGALTAAVEGARREHQRQVETQRDDIAELRSRIDVGPAQLVSLQTEQARADARQGRVSVPMLFGGLGALATFMTIVVVSANWLSTSHRSSSTPVVTCSASYHPAPCP